MVLTPLRRARSLARLVLAWFVLSLGVAIASPVVKPQAIEFICSAGGALKAVAFGDADGKSVAPIGASHLDCPLCMLGGAPPPSVFSQPRMAQPEPSGALARSIPAARRALLALAPLPARGPPAHA